MGEKSIIPNALDLAQRIASIIITESYATGFSDPAVKDVLLFGSTIRKEPAHDIDLLVIHDHSPLDEFGYATVYSEEAGRIVPDQNATGLEAGFKAEDILSCLGSKSVMDIFEAGMDIRNNMNKQVRDMQTVSGDLPGGYKYTGTLDLPYVGEIVFSKPVTYDEICSRVDAAIKETINNPSVFLRVRSLMTEQRLALNEVLDIHTMNVGLLDPEGMAEERKIVISQCTDPTLWHTVLTTGKLYNPDSNSFDLAVDKKYVGASKLFPS